MTYDKQIEEIRACGMALLERGDVDVILGYTSNGDAMIPFFARTPDDVNKLDWGHNCKQNLAPYLANRADRVAIVAKPCDVRAIVQLIAEGQLSRSHVYIIGVDCGGMKDIAGNPRPGCDECRVHTPPIYDTHIADGRVLQTQANTESEKSSNTLSRFRQEIEKCILCYACRQACYGCYCQTCFAERTTPSWLPANIDSGTKMAFHLGRAMHLAGRCVECGGCEAACASDVKLRYIIKEITAFVEEAYDYQAGMDTEATPPLTIYGADDKEIGFM